MRTIRPTRLIVRDLKASPGDAQLKFELRRAQEIAKPFDSVASPLAPYRKRNTSVVVEEGAMEFPAQRRQA
jgi:hypothetical protein